MDDSPDDPPLARAADWFRATPLELAGLAILLTGALTASWALWWSASQRPSELPSAALEVGAEPDELGFAPEQRPDPGGIGPSDDPHGSGGPAASDEPAEATTAELMVHVTGGVVAPGLVVVPGGARVGEAVAAAGGLAPDAMPELVNLARILADGEHVHVPRIGEDPLPVSPSGTGPTGGAPTATGDGRIDLNHATVDELETLPGIGPARADAIVRHRETIGPFEVPGDLREVPGIGEAIFQRLADLITVR